jgi:hypothetical protein
MAHGRRKQNAALGRLLRISRFADIRGFMGRNAVVWDCSIRDGIDADFRGLKFRARTHAPARAGTYEAAEQYRPK